MHAPHYDAVLIGGGITGSFCAYFLAQAGKKILLVDAPSLHRPASLAAGAFITPKIGKPTLLSHYTDIAYAFVLELYKTEQFKAFFHSTPLLQIPQESRDIDIFAQWASSHDTAIAPHDTPVGTLLIEEAGIVDAAKILHFLQQHFEVSHKEVQEIHRTSLGWKVEEWSTSHLILAQGAMPALIDEPYMQIRPVWGERIEIEVPIEHNAYTRHRFVSLSATLDEKRIIIGATHEQGKREGALSPTAISALLAKAQEMLPLSPQPKIIDHRAGARAGTVDYLPLVGRIVDADATLAAHPRLKKGARIDSEAFTYHTNVSIINGVGGRGFVLGPWLAWLLTQNILLGEAIPHTLEPQRLFVRYAKRLK
ncbi:MAG: hypothetical protein KU37_10130 [Sulfuricurvum sp. PC08-66]|nr:MAG: hypothetical protein KU37_10130 [Sulfuricurvum sp. PC08-66]